jgi:prepilin-type N-terminal cleavage/methylation domain-containing protein
LAKTNPLFLIAFEKLIVVLNKKAFTLLEMVTVITILSILMTLGASFLNETGSQIRNTNTDMLIGLIEQARIKAITSRSYVVLGIQEPETLTDHNQCCRIGMFEVKKWPDSATVPMVLEGQLLNRWQKLNTGIVLMRGDIDGIENLLDMPQILITHGGGKNLSNRIYAMVFHPRGGISFPLGSAPMTIRLAEGGYHDGKAIPKKHGKQQHIFENRLKIGRITARAYQIN